MESHLRATMLSCFDPSRGNLFALQCAREVYISKERLSIETHCSISAAVEDRSS